MTSETLDGSGPKKRRRSRKRSRKSKLKKTCEGIDSDDRGRKDSTGRETEEGDVSGKEEKEKDRSQEENAGDKCGCQVEQGLGRKRRRRSRRRMKKLGLVDILSCETIDDYTTDEYFNAQDLEFVVPAFKVHERCEHPMYVPKSMLPEAQSPIPEVAETQPEGEDSQTVNTGFAHPSKRTKVREEEGSALEDSGRDDEPVLRPEYASDPVNSIDGINMGDIIYFDQLTLRGSEPAIERRKAKVFLVMKDPGTGVGPSVLLRTYASFDALNPATWDPKDDPLSDEPLIIKFEELHGIRKRRAA